MTKNCEYIFKQIQEVEREAEILKAMLSVRGISLSTKQRNTIGERLVELEAGLSRLDDIAKKLSCAIPEEVKEEHWKLADEINKEWNS
jgi:hypothetical protein